MSHPEHDFYLFSKYIANLTVPFQFAEMISTKQLLKLPQVRVELLTPTLEEVTSLSMATQALLVLNWLRKFMVDQNMSLEESTEKVRQLTFGHLPFFA